MAHFVFDKWQRWLTVSCLQGYRRDDMNELMSVEYIHVPAWSRANVTLEFVTVAGVFDKSRKSGIFHWLTKFDFVSWLWLIVTFVSSICHLIVVRSNTEYLVKNILLENIGLQIETLNVFDIGVNKRIFNYKIIITCTYAQIIINVLKYFLRVYSILPWHSRISLWFQYTIFKIILF